MKAKTNPPTTTNDMDVCKSLLNCIWLKVDCSKHTHIGTDTQKANKVYQNCEHK